MDNVSVCNMAAMSRAQDLIEHDDNESWELCPGPKDLIEHDDNNAKNIFIFYCSQGCVIVCLFVLPRWTRSALVKCFKRKTIQLVSDKHRDDAVVSFHPTLSQRVHSGHLVTQCNEPPRCLNLAKFGAS